MKNLVSLFVTAILITSIFSSCTKENSEIISEEPINKRMGFFELCFIENDPIDVSNMNLCTETYGLGTITSTVDWSHPTNQDISDELKDIFYCTDEFSTCTGAMLPQEICNVTFTLEEYQMPIFFTYNYLSDNIPPSVSNQLKQHFACEIKDYGDANYLDYKVANVAFYIDQLLCDDCSSGLDSRLLTANASYYIY